MSSPDVPVEAAGEGDIFAAASGKAPIEAVQTGQAGSPETQPEIEPEAVAATVKAEPEEAADQPSGEPCLCCWTKLERPLPDSRQSDRDVCF